MRSVLLLFTLLLVHPLAAQHAHHHDRVIRFPDVDGYVTLVCDLHLHTVFSDGSVWPNIRVQEAIRDGLDVIAVTDHIEYQPHSDDIPHPDRNRSHQIAEAAAMGSDLIVLRGSEITRRMPPGHANAIFLNDVNPLIVDDSIAVFREANRQGAFVFWNHPNWMAQKNDGVAALTDVHRLLIREGLLHGIEVVNDVTFSEEALQIALDHDLAVIGTSDIHGLIDWQYEVPEGGHRPVTLVFATERSAEGVREGLEARRTVVWFNDTLIGQEEHLAVLLAATLQVANAQYDGDSSVLQLGLENSSDAELILQNRSNYTLHQEADVFTVAPQSTYALHVKTVERADSVSLAFDVLNAVVAPGRYASIVLETETGFVETENEPGSDR